MTSLEYLESIKTNLLATLATDTATPGVDYSIDGQSVSRSAWRNSLWAQIVEINALIAAEDPTELRSQAI